MTDLQATADYFKITEEQLTGTKRLQRFVQARQFFSAYLLSKHYSLTRIASILFRKHCTIINYRDNHKGEMRFNDDYRQDYEDYLNYLGIFTPIIPNEKEIISKRDTEWQEALIKFYGKMLNSSLVEKIVDNFS